MNKLFVYIELRPAVRDDFADQFDRKKIGTAYFLQNAAGVIEKKVNYFNENTDLDDFKRLYANNQVFVMLNPNEVLITNDKD